MNDYKNWKWQEKNSVVSCDKLFEVFPNLDQEIKVDIEDACKQIKFKLTPYLISLIKKDQNGNPYKDDPIWKQAIPIPKYAVDINSSFSDLEDNWEVNSEMINPILHHKYPDRVILRVKNNCMGYCMYCFESKRTLDKNSKKDKFNSDFLSNSLNYIKNHSEINEVILSGGEPLLMNNNELDKILNDIHVIRHVKFIRIHTRAMTHNPFRIDTDLVKILKKYNVSSINNHFTHPNEITADLKKCIEVFDKNNYRPIMLAHIPLLKGINNDIDTLILLFKELYNLRIIPYYLLHAMPNTLGSSEFRTSVKKGVEIMRNLRRFYSNPAIPEYIIVHKEGKHTIPIELNGTSEFEYHNGYISFLNWKNNWCKYYEGILNNE